MPRWVVFVVVCVFLGVVTSVGVAWGLAWDWPLRSNNVYQSKAYVPTGLVHPTDGPTLWDADWYEGRWTNTLRVRCRPESSLITSQPLGTFRGEFDRWTAKPACRGALQRHAALPQTRDYWFIDFRVTLVGWPWQCVASEDSCNTDDIRAALNSSRRPSPTAELATIDPAFNMPPHFGAIEFGRRLLPTFPLWPGLLADTAFYGGAWAILLGTPILIRRWIRSRRGGCPACGYSLEGLKDGAPCPECGAAPTTRPGATASEASPLASGS